MDIVIIKVFWAHLILMPCEFTLLSLSIFADLLHIHLLNLLKVLQIRKSPSQANQGKFD